MIHPMLRQPNARFWVWLNDGWVKLTLRPDQTLTWGKGGPTDEGWSSELNIWDHRSSCIEHRWRDSGCDCDGPITRTGVNYCELANLRSRRVYGLYNGELEATLGMMVPAWEPARPTFVEDAFAEAAGY